MVKLMGVNLDQIIKGEECVFLCFDWLQDHEKQGRRIKVRCGNRKFLTTRFETDDSESIRFVRWKNHVDDSVFEIIRPDVVIDQNLIKIDLTKEFNKMGICLYDGEELDGRLVRTRGR